MYTDQKDSDCKFIYYCLTPSDVQINLAAGISLTASEYVAAQQIRTWAIRELTKIYENVDVIITPGISDITQELIW